MEKSIRLMFFALVMLTAFLVGCAPAAAPVLPTLTPASTETAIPTETPLPTATPVPSATPVLTTSEEFTAAAWNAYLEEDYSLAIELAQETIDRWEDEATEQQALIEKAPPVGTVTNAKKEEIFSYASLNDVGTAYFIMAISLEELGRVDEAKAAYEGAISLPYARCWDPKGWFWSPSQVAKENMAKMP